MTVLPPTHDATSQTRVTRLRCQHDDRLTAVPPGPVLLRWEAESDAAAACQLGYEVQTRATGGDWIASDVVPSSAAIDIPAGTVPLAPREIREHRVRIGTPDGWTAWSETLTVEGAITAAELTAEVIDIDSVTEGPAPVFRREFTLEAVPLRARLYISALGVYEVRVNGERVTDGILNPGWTSYQERILLDTVDVGRNLRVGANAIEITVADGWYRGRMGFADRTEIYGDRIGPIAQLELTDRDGHVATLVTDTTWRGGFGAVRCASIYDGTAIDLTAAVDSASPGFDDSHWQPARIVPFDRDVFIPRPLVPVREIATLPMSLTERDGAIALDAHQNISGWVRLDVEGRRGATVTVRHAEVLEPDGALHTAALRTAKATDTYVLDRDGRHKLEPVFTFHGFRYAEVVGDVQIISADAVAISSDLRPRSEFHSSHAALDRFHENVAWSQRDNFVSLPTDCPQRDERLGWTGDAQAFAATANTLFDSESFWASWLRDLEVEQDDDGAVASLVPNIIVPGDLLMGGAAVDDMGRAGWADAATIVPMASYDAYGSAEVLRVQLTSMRRWVEHLRRRAGSDVLLPEEPFQYGDWLDPDAPGDRPWEAKTSPLFVANCFYARSAALLARAEEILGEDATAHRELASRVAAAVWDRWQDEALLTQTGAALCLEFDIAPEGERAALAEALAANVRAENGRIATGFLGTPLVLFALSRNGHLTEAYRMLLRREAPSWLYQVDRGATTVWERWDAIKPDGTIHNGAMDSKEGDSMISFNHYAYGAVIDWVYRTVAGLDPIEPGYRAVRIAPRPAESLRHARAQVRTPYGILAIDWEVMDDGAFRAELTVPFGVRAHLDLPTTSRSTVTVDGAPAPAPATLAHGRHRLEVTAAAVVPSDAPSS
ncbi:alpha-L-rhamnosidase [Microbacterium sp. zg.Y909]|uniref:alpha-L-rhamnosidase n=1 Tax=Microbacterium sp. zg.Y909 TaxID=2969413 RepID=UPI00214D01FF|nr:alpha-L-rhamnosidase [Microbacterium sp. zg.Y909]MCR2824383.1 glycoside hydrolase family 78 protein [Microbacterium sp. zg.Y909]